MTPPSSAADRGAARPHAGDGPTTAANDPVVHVYRLLLEQPSLDLEQLAARLQREQDEVRSILNRLTDVALLQSLHNEYSTIVAVSPIVAMLRLIAREQLFLRQRHQFLAQSYDTFSSILGGHAGVLNDTDDAELAEQLSDLPSVRRRLEELAVTAREEVLSFSPVASNPTATRAASRPLDMDALKRGVRMRTIYTDSLAFEPAALEYARELVDAGAQVRLVPRLPMRLIVTDQLTAVLPRSLNDISQGAIVIQQESIVGALIALFEAVWHQGRQLPGMKVEETECSPIEQVIIGLLATGAKDDTVARHIGTSVRTVRRIIADLMDRAHVESRFALGVHAAARQWV